MTANLSKLNQNGRQKPPMQEVEFALILARMINTVKEDPAQLRVAVYEFARAKLKEEINWADAAERERLMAAFETAIQGVEDFSVRAAVKEQLPGPASTRRADISAGSSSSALVAKAGNLGGVARPAINPDIPIRLLPKDPDHTRTLLSVWSRMAIGIVLVFVIVGAVAYKQRGGGSAHLPLVATTASPIPAEMQASDQAAGIAALRKAVLNAGLGQKPPFPLPSVYGVYALQGDKLAELEVLPERVPDKRISMSTPITKPSSTVLPDGRVRFIVFRRDVSTNAPDRVDVRVVAKVMRAISFDAKKGRNITPVEDTWNIRNNAYEFRVRPIPENPEMLLIQPEDQNFALPPGRYILALGTQALDFTVAGDIKDLAQCIERTEAANGTFYSECQKL